MNSLPTPPIFSPQTIDSCLTDITDLVECATADGADDLYAALTERYSDWGVAGEDFEPLVLEPRWNRLDMPVLLAGWSMLGCLMLRERLEEATALARRSHSVFGFEASPRAINWMLEGVPEEIAQAPWHVRPWAGSISHLSPYVRGTGGDPDEVHDAGWSEPNGPAGLLSYAVARAAVRQLRGPIKHSVLRDTLGRRRWEKLQDEAKSRGLAEDWAWGFLLPERVFARALMVTGEDGEPLPGVPERLDWRAYVEDLERTVLDHPRLCLSPPFGPS